MLDVTFVSLPVVLPIITAIITLLIGKYLKKAIHLLPLIGIGGAALVSFSFLLEDKLSGGLGFYIDFFFPKNFLGLIDPKIGFWLDPLSVFMVSIVSGLSFLIAFFSIDYMSDDDHLVRYWFFFQVFVAGMNLLVLAADLLFLYVGWEMVGLCSYALIGHWFRKSGEEGRKPALAGLKAFIYTHIGDFGLLLAIAIIFNETGVLNLHELLTQLNLPTEMYSLVLALVFFGAIGKSAQFPLLTWLSSPDSVDIDAMQGPTTVSALIHAATMVKAGVYLMARFFPIFRDHNITDFSIFMSIIVGITVLISALSALTAKDIKRVLAYSTISQLSYMFLALCVAYFAYGENKELGNLAFLASQWHVLSHAVFKALLFLAAGAIIHATHTRSIFEMGGLRKRMPVVFYTMIIGAAALMGIPLLSGFFSKEAVIGVALEFALEGGDYAFWGWLLYLIGLSAAFLTAAYTTRMLMLVFSGTPQTEGAEKAHKSNFIMQIPLVILAVLAFIVGFIPDLIGDFFSGMLGAEHEAHLHFIPPLDEPELLLSMLLVISTVALGILVCFFIYRDGKRSWTLPKIPGIKALQEIIAEGFYLDQLYSWIGDQIVDTFAAVRKIHTGDSNINMIGVGLVMATLIVVVIIL
ncbi:MAG: NADH-quinone oxidoreductase subunit 5 family protein [Candidatus Hodarchaeales archaeon]